MIDTPSIVVVNGARTAIGRYAGSLSAVDGYVLGAAAVREAISRSGIEGADVDEVIMGCVGQVGPDAYNARRVSIEAGLPYGTTAFTVNRLCGSGLQAIISGAIQLQVGASDVVVAGGNESMSRLPWLVPDARAGHRLGDRAIVDGTLAILTDPWSNQPMGVTAENVAREYGVSRSAQDDYALLSQRRTATAISRGAFSEQIASVSVAGRKGVTLVTEDEHPRPETTIDDLSRLRPAFADEGTVTAGNSSGINDGGAAVVLMREKDAQAQGLTPRMRLVSWAKGAMDPQLMGFAPAVAVERVLQASGMTIDDIDVIELNEAFAAQVVAVMRATGMSPDRTNPNGGAIALGHPVGATGAILTVKLAHDLADRDLQTGMVTMCIGGGQALAAVFERC
ncbi:MAG: thiolase family protein [Actinomycetota bacterium]|nr:thiolase family protein [Actinomycetota bacterium]